MEFRNPQGVRDFKQDCRFSNEEMALILRRPGPFGMAITFQGKHRIAQTIRWEPHSGSALSLSAINPLF
jgi:hypothetical protein